MRILIADDSEPVRRALRRLLARQQDWEICGEAADGPDTVEKARELHPDLVLLDLSMPLTNGFESARAIREAVPDTRILIMSQNDADQFLPSALEAGADGCLDKSRIANDLIRAVKKTLGG